MGVSIPVPIPIAIPIPVKRCSPARWIRLQDNADNLIRVLASVRFVLGFRERGG